VNTWSDFKETAQWRNQIWDMATWKLWPGRTKCPLLNLPFTSALSVALDWMRSKYLGVAQYVYGSVLALLTVQIMPNDPQANLNRIWSDIVSYYRMHNTKVRYRYLNKLTMYLRKSGTPKLRGKAGEIRHLAHPMLHIWNKHMGAESDVNLQIRALLKQSCALEDLLSEYRDELFFPPPVGPLPADLQNTYATTYCHCIALRFPSARGLAGDDFLKHHHS